MHEVLKKIIQKIDLEIDNSKKHKKRILFLGDCGHEDTAEIDGFIEGLRVVKDFIENETTLWKNET